MFKNKSETKKFIIIAISLALFLIPTFFVLAANPEAGQGVLGGGLIGATNILVGSICNIIVLVLSLLLWLIGTVFDWVIGGTTIDAPAMNQVVTAGWVIVRDILNIIFVLALLGIAFATILRIEAYHFKALLPKLLVAALLVNFSKTIALTLIDFSNAIMQAIMGTQNGMTASAALLAMFNVSSFFDLNLDLWRQVNSWSMEPAVLATNITVVIFLGMLCMALAGLAVLLIIRTVVLMILTVFSPIAFVLNVLPVTQKYASKWWEEFTKYLFVGPIVCICYLLALLFAVKFSQGGGIQGMANSIGSQFQTNAGVSGGTIGQLFGLSIACGIMFVGFTFTKEAAAGMAGAAMNMVKKGLLGAGMMAGKFGLRKAADMKNWKSVQGLNNRFFKPWGQALQGRIDAAGAGGALGEKALLRTGKILGGALSGVAWGARRGIGFGMGWKQRSARLWGETMEPVAGEAHDMLNYVLGLGEKTRYGTMARKNLLYKKKKESYSKSSSEMVGITDDADSMMEKGVGMLNLAESNNLLNDYVLRVSGKHRQLLIDDCKERGIFRNEDAREKYEIAFDANYNTNRTAGQDHETSETNAKRDALAGLADDDFLVTATSDPVADPRLLKTILRAELGDSSEAAEIINDIAEISGDSGNTALYGMAGFDAKRGRFVINDDDTQAAIVEDKRRKVNTRKMLNNMHSNAIFGETTDGRLTDVHEQGYHLLTHQDWSGANGMGEHARDDLKDGFMAINSRGVANHLDIKRRARRDITNLPGSARLKMQRELDKINAIAPADLTPSQRKSIDFITKEQSTLLSRSQAAYGTAMWVEFMKTGNVTDENGAPIAGITNLADVRHWVETNVV